MIDMMFIDDDTNEVRTLNAIADAYASAYADSDVELVEQKLANLRIDQSVTIRLEEAFSVTFTRVS